MTLEQRRAIAMASARARAAEAGADEARTDPRDSLLGKVDAVVRGAADMLTFGFSDEIAAGLGTGFGYLGDYQQELARQRGIDAADAENRFGYRLGGQIAGGVGIGLGTAGAGLSAATNAVRAGAGLGKVAMGSAADGAIMGGLYGAGSGEGAGGRLADAVIGGGTGFLVGAAAPYALAGVQAAASPFVRPIMSRLQPDTYANRVLADTLRRSGKSIDDVEGALTRAHADGQDMYTVADALGNAGQRRLSAIARSPHDARQSVVETLERRQAGQGERLSSYLADGFGAPDTAAQRAATLTDARNTAADIGYAAAREGAGLVDVSPAIKLIDEVLQPGISSLASPQTGIADDTVEGVLRMVRSRLTDGRSVVSDFSAALRVKQDIDDMIGRATRAGAGNQARLLMGVQAELDNALTQASTPYAAARDAYRQGSRAIEAVDTGRTAASGRSRATDNIAQFNGLTEAEQSAFRAGYVDPLIARVEASAASPTTNKARALITEKTGRDFPAFAAPGQGERLGDRIAREQRMFDTANASLGGSKTADNLADAADLGGAAPEVAVNLVKGRPVAAVMGVIGDAIARGQQGLSPGVTERLTRALLSTDPSAVKTILGTPTAAMTRADIRQAILGMILGQQAGAMAAR